MTRDLLARLVGVVAALALGAGGSLAGATAASATAPGAADAPVIVSEYPGDPVAEAALVAAEERRLIDIRTISNAAMWTGAGNGTPYRVLTGATYTLVLTERSAAYSFDDLLELSPRTLVEQPDGSYLLLENIVVESGAALNLSSDTGLVLRMVSTPDVFVSIATVGGSLAVVGTAEEPVEVTSWNPTTERVDSDTTDGRSYVRVIGGQANLSNVTFDHLGFWSGITGGVSLTGNVLPGDASAPQTDAPSAAGSEATGTAEPANDVVYGNELIPADDPLATLHLEPSLRGYSYTSATVNQVTFSNNAFGLFVSGAQGVDVRNAVAENNLVSGIVFHRNVTDSRISSSRALGNSVDGFAISRASTGIVFDGLTATRNGRNGISMDGRPLAQGPSATGNPVGAYGSNRVSNCTLTFNARYGIDVVGGTDFVIDRNTASDNVMGIVVRDGTDGVVLSDNVVERSEQQGIAAREGVRNATVTGNRVASTRIGIYFRNTGGLIDRNVIDDVDSHAITVIGESAVSTITRNTVTGVGPTAIDVARTQKSTLEGNVSTGWTSTKPLDVVLRNIFQPLTVLWLSLALLVLITAITGFSRKRVGIVHPYANLAPLSTLSKGVIAPPHLEAPELELTR